MTQRTWRRVRGPVTADTVWLLLENLGMEVPGSFRVEDRAASCCRRLVISLAFCFPST
jgi:hypothetical protein